MSKNETDPASATAIRHWEDYRVGETANAMPRRITQEDLAAFAVLNGDDNPTPNTGAGVSSRPTLHGPCGLGLFLGALRSLGWDQSVLALLDTRWNYLAPIHVGDDITCHVTIIGKQRSATTGRGILRRQIRLVNQDGLTVQEGSSAALVVARSDDQPPAALQFGAPEWAEAVAGKLDRNPNFTAAVAAYDGTIGLAIGEAEVHFRIYRGRIIDASRRSLRGADFVLSASEVTWVELLLGEHNDFMQRVMTGQFWARGNGAEYLRMTKVLIQLVDAARDLACEELGQ